MYGSTPWYIMRVIAQFLSILFVHSAHTQRVPYSVPTTQHVPGTLYTLPILALIKVIIGQMRLVDKPRKTSNNLHTHAHTHSVMLCLFIAIDRLKHTHIQTEHSPLWMANKISECECECWTLKIDKQLCRRRLIKKESARVLEKQKKRERPKSS